jgi:hypothetical protein
MDLSISLRSHVKVLNLIVILFLLTSCVSADQPGGCKITGAAVPLIVTIFIAYVIGLISCLLTLVYVYLYFKVLTEAGNHMRKYAMAEISVYLKLTGAMAIIIGLMFLLIRVLGLPICI